MGEGGLSSTTPLKKVYTSETKKAQTSLFSEKTSTN